MLSQSSPAQSPDQSSGHRSPDRSDLVISIINYRTGEMTIACIRSVLDEIAANPGLDAHVAVVDNASGDGSAEAIEAWLAEEAAGNGTPPPVTLVRSPTNTGFSGGHNQGMAARDADFYLLFNSDAVLRPGFLAALMGAARAAPPGTGFWAPRLESADETPQISHFRFFSLWSELMRGAETGPVTRALARHDIPLGIDPDPDQVDWASFACILMDGRMVREIGPMDEGYFLYYEDAEYCLRARRAGWRVMPVLAARSVHHRGGSGPVKALAAAKKRMPAYFYASRTRFFRQAYGRAGPIAANLLWFLGRAVANLRVLVGEKVPPANDAEMRDIWTNFLTPLGDRRATD